MDKIDLDAIYNKVYYGYSSKDTEWIAKEAMKQAIHQALVLASEKATLQELNAHNGEIVWDGLESYHDENPNGPDSTIVVDKQSILGVEKLII